jgi:hypothetical protein
LRADATPLLVLSLSPYREVIMLAKRFTTLLFTLAVLMMFTPHAVVAEGHEKEEKEKISVCKLVPEFAVEWVCGKKKIIKP